MNTRWVPPTLDESEVEDFLTIKAGIPQQHVVPSLDG